MKHLAFFIICACLKISLQANTVLPSVIIENTVLTKANSPYSIASSLKVNAGISLTIEAGVIINIAPSITLTISGNIYCEGTEADSIYFKCSTVGKSWAILNFSGTEAIFKYTNIRSAKRFISATGGNNIQILHCNIESTALGYGEDCIAAHDTKKVTIDNIILKGAGGKISSGIKNDAIDLDALDSCFITNSIITNFSDDAIDIGTETKYAFIAFNTTSYSDYGISIGESTNATVYRNISHHNRAGIQVHNKATVYAANNTIYANTWGIECFHSEESDPSGSGGNLHLSNTIITNSTNESIIVVASSTVTNSHCITDKSPALEGTANLLGSALLKNPTQGDFSLSTGSLCIDAGEADSLQAFFGNATDIGAIEYTGATQISALNDELIDLQIFPNPAVKTLHYTTKLNNVKLLKASIINTNGQLVKQIELNAVVGSISLDGLPQGLYNIKIENGVNYTSKLFVIQ